MLLDQVWDLGDVRAIHRREVVAVVDVEPAGRDLQHLGEEIAVRPAAVQVVLSGAEVVQAGGDAALRCGAALAHRVLFERRIDAGVHVRVDHARKREPAFAVVDRLRFRGGRLVPTLANFSPVMAMSRVLDRARVRPHHAHVLDQEVVRHFSRFSRCGSRPPSRTISMRCGGMGSKARSLDRVVRSNTSFVESRCSRRSPSRIRFASAADQRRQAEVERVAVEQAGEGLGDERRDAEMLERRGRLLARGAAAEIAAGDDEVARF